MGTYRLALALGITTLATSNNALAQSAPATPVSEPPPPIEDPRPTADAAAARERARFRFGIGGGFGAGFSGFVAAGGPAIQLALGVQLNDRWAIYAQGLAQSIVFIGNLQGALMAEWSIDPSLATLSVGAGTAFTFQLVGPPCASCIPPQELALALPIEVGVHSHRRTSTQIHRAGFRFAIQLTPTYAVWRNAVYSAPSPLGIAFSLQFGWALR